MGQEIADSRFSQRDFDAFATRLARETELLRSWFEQGRFADEPPTAGMELEAWLVDRAGDPACVNAELLERLGDPLVVPELACFNVELNGPAEVLTGGAIGRMARGLEGLWARCNRAAAEFDARLAMIGILPTLAPSDLTLAHMSPLQRYAALNEQVFRLRGGTPVRLDLRGEDRLRLSQRNVMLEAAATSFQIHLKVSPREAVRCYNAAKILSAPMVALAANSPFLFGRRLWHETRIPLFEQAIAVGGSDLTKRVSFGVRYARDSIMECFDANRDRYPVLLPRLMDEPEHALAHLRLHNGTIWRWNRPLIGFDADAKPHLRIEHRVVAAGPTVADMIANAACFFGASRDLIDLDEPPEQALTFEQARDNFYAAARHGLDAKLVWLDRRRHRVADLLVERLLPQAADGLARLGIDRAEIDHWLGIARERVESGQTGAVWQRRFVDRFGADFHALVAAYIERQERGEPVARWTL